MGDLLVYFFSFILFSFSVERFNFCSFKKFRKCIGCFEIFSHQNNDVDSVSTYTDIEHIVKKVASKK